jgi:peptidoglycan hydrolase-like protein with peptidoglycan-binding domain
VQYYLSELGYDPGGLDGQWGARTQAAAQAFSDDWGTGQGTIDLNVAVAGSNLFGVALRSAAREAGLDMTIVPPSTGSGGAGVAPEASPGPQKVAFEPETIVGRVPGGSAGLMAFGLLGVGAFLVFSKKR